MRNILLYSVWIVNRKFDIIYYVKILTHIAFAAALAILSPGCFSFSASRAPENAAASGASNYEHAVVANHGWYLFDRLPLVCGNADEQARFPWKLVSGDHVREDVLTARLTSYAAANGLEVTGANVFNQKDVLMYVYSIPVPIPYLLCRHEMQISATLAKFPTSSSASARSRLGREMKTLLDKIPDGGDL